MLEPERPMQGKQTMTIALLHGLAQAKGHRGQKNSKQGPQGLRKHHQDMANVVVMANVFAEGRDGQCVRRGP